MVKIETRCRIPIWQTFGRIQWHVVPDAAAIATGRIQCHVIPEPRITLQGAATWWIHSHDSRATCHIAGYSHLAKSMSRSWHIARCNNSIRHIENRFLPNFFGYFNAVWALTNGGFLIVLVFFYVEPGVKINGADNCDMLLMQKLLPVIRQISGNEFVFQQDSAPAHCLWDNWALTLRESRLYFTGTVATKQSRS